MTTETTELLKPESLEKSTQAFSFPALRLNSNDLKDKHGKLKLKRLCLQFVFRNGEFSLIAYKLDEQRRWMDSGNQPATDSKEAMITSYAAVPKLIKLENDPDAKDVAVLQTKNEVLFPQLELSRRQLERLLEKSPDDYIRFTPKKGSLNPDYVFYDANTTASTETANPCPPYPSENAS